MRFMSFTPEVTRLRRLARACQAGEVSRHEYRASRRAIIDQLTCTEGTNFEDTVPRFDRDITLRRQYASQSESDGSAGLPGWSWWWIGVLILILALPVVALAEPATDPTIAPVAQRDPNPLQSPRLQITSVKWTVPDALSEHIDQTDIDRFLADSLAVEKQANAPAAHGFNDAELEEVARLLSALGVHEASTQLTLADLEDLQAVITQQKLRRGVSVLQLEQIAQGLEQKIQASGFALAQAYVPAQAVVGQTVKLEVQVGALANVVVTPADGEQNAADNPAGLASRFSHLLGKAVRQVDVESELNRLNRLPGLVAQARFVPGEAVGETVLELNVAEFETFTGAVQIDNHGYEPTGETRLSLSGQWNNPLGRGDGLTATALTGLESGDQHYAKLRYMSPMLQGRYEGIASLGLGDAQIDDLGGEAVEGDLLTFELGLGEVMHLTRTGSSEFYVGAGVHDLDWTVPQVSPLLPEQAQQQAWFGVGQWRGHKLWDEARMALSGGIGVHAGRLDEARFDQSESFYRLRADIQAWRVLGEPLRLFGYDRAAKGLLSVRGQLSNTSLPSTLRLTASGPNANRGFAPGQGYDDGLSVHAQLQFDHAHGAWWLFVDTGYGEQHRFADQWLHQTSAGLGFEARLGSWQQGELSTRFSVGVPLTQTSSLNESELGDEDVQVFWTLKFAP